MSSNLPTKQNKSKSKGERRDGTLEKKCSVCQIIKVKECYSSNQWKRPALVIKCHVCIVQEQTYDNDTIEKVCSICLVLKCQNFFSKNQWKGSCSSRKCKPCVEKEMPSSSTTSKNKRSTLQEVSYSRTLINHDHNSNGTSTSSDIQSPTRKKKKKKHSDEAKKQLSMEEKKQILAHRIQILPKGQTAVKTFHVIYDTYTPISDIDEQNMMDKVIERGYYGPFPESIQTQHNLEAYIESGKTKMDIFQALSFRSALLQLKAKKRNWFIKTNVKYLSKEYQKGTSIVHIAKYHDLPPMNVLRHVLSDMNFSKRKIKRCFKNPQQELEEREEREFYAADALDCISTSNQDEVLKNAEAFEKNIESVLVQMNISFITQKDLEEEQKRDFGVPFVTPDFLILDELFVNGQRIHWIDAKAFYGSNIKSQISDTTRQMARYIELWGTGSIIFLRGYNEMFLIDNCIMMDWITFSESKVTSTHS